MGYVPFKSLDNAQFSKLLNENGSEFTAPQKDAWHQEMRSRLWKHAHSFTKTMVVIDLTNGPVEALCGGYKPSRKDVAFVVQKAAKMALQPHKKLVVKAPSTGTPEACEARDQFMRELGFKWVGGKLNRYEMTF